MSFRSSFRRWWQLPRKTGEPRKDRRVSFLELFYDLVFVVIIGQLSDTLAEDINLTSIGIYVFLFIIVWLAWVNGSEYHDLHGQNDIRTRVFTFVQMIIIAAIAIFVHNAPGDGSAGFAASYAAYLIILTWMWWRTGVYDPDDRPVTQPYALTFLLSALLFIASIFVPGSFRFYMWGFAVLLRLALPIVLISMYKHNPKARARVDMVYNVSPELVERFGLFTIIVLGEVIISVIQGIIAIDNITVIIGVIGLLGGMMTAVALWWIYFDTVSSRLPRRERIMTFSWSYLHMPMTMGIAALSAGILNVATHAGVPMPVEVRWLIVTMTAIALISISLLMRVVQTSHRKEYRLAARLTLVSAIIILIMGFFDIHIIPLLIVMTVLMLFPVVYAWVVHVKISAPAS